MIKNTNSRLKFSHIPNKLISFINYQCTLRDEPIKVDISEQDFIKEVYDPITRVIERRRSRRSGGSTLLALIGFYYMLQNKRVLYYGESAKMAQHFLRSTIDEIDILGFEKKIDTPINPSSSFTVMRLEMHGAPSKSMRIVGGNGQTRGVKVDIILADALLTRSIENINKLYERLYPCLNPEGKLILNMISGP